MSRLITRVILNFTIALILIGQLFLAEVAFAKDEIAVLLKSTSHPFWKVLYDSIFETAKNNKISIILQSTNKINDIEGQLNICETILLESPKALIVGAINPFNLGTCLKKFSAKNIPIIDIDGNLTKEIANKVGFKLAFSVASNNYKIGETAAKYLAKEKGKILILEGLAGSYTGIQRVEGFKDNLPKV